MASDIEYGLRITRMDAEPDEPDETRRDEESSTDADMANLRDAFVDACNARDLEEVKGLCSPDVECPDLHGDTVDELASELVELWERVPGLILTAARLDDEACAMAWRPDEDGCWTRAALVMIGVEDSEITCVGLLDDPDRLERALTDDPTGEELEEGTAWIEWSAGEEAPTARRR